MSQLYINTVTLKGFIANPPLVKEKIVKFTISTTKEFYKDGETKKVTSYVPCVAFGHEANIAKNFGKGDLVMLAASLRQDSYEKDGQKIYQTNVVAESVVLCKKAEPKKDEGAAPEEDLGFDEGNAPF